MLSEYIKPLKGLAPAADRFNTGPQTDVYCMKNYEKLSFFVYHEGGTTGVAALKVYAGTDNAGTDPTAVKFNYRHMTTGDSEALGAITEAVAADGVSTVAGEETIIEIEVNARDLPEGKPWVYLDTTESANDPVNAAIFVFAHSARFAGDSMPLALS